MSPVARRIKMSEYHLPFHIPEEIMKRLPVKSLVRFRSVSKAWKSLIDSSQFIAAHYVHSQTQPQHLLVSYEVPMNELNFVSYTDDHIFPQEWSVPTLPLSVKELKNPIVVGSSRGLLCLYGAHRDMFVLWNPSIRRSIVVIAESKLSSAGFGVCPMTSDPKIVSIPLYQSNQNNETSYRWEVMVYTLSSRKWRSLSINLATKQIQYWCMPAVVIDQFIYWCAGTQTHNMIMSFDMTNESFELIDLPDNLAHRGPLVLHISKLKESLAILQCGTNISTVWMMEDGAQRSFRKLFTIKTPHNYIVGFRKNGIPIVNVTGGDPDDDDDPEAVRLARLVAYEPNSEHNKSVFQSYISNFPIHMKSYVETLLLLGHSDCDSD